MDRSEWSGSYVLTVKSGGKAIRVMKTVIEILRFLNSVLAQGMYTITAFPLLKTGFSLKGAARISGFSSVFWPGFLLFPLGQQGVVVKINERGRKGRANLKKETQRAKNIDISYKLYICCRRAGVLGIYQS